jgi:hypothetical protein
LTETLECNSDTQMAAESVAAEYWHAASMKSMKPARGAGFEVNETGTDAGFDFRRSSQLECLTLEWK